MLKDAMRRIRIHTTIGPNALPLQIEEVLLVSVLLYFLHFYASVLSSLFIHSLISFILSAFCLLFYFCLTSFLHQLLFIISFFFLVRVCSTERPKHDTINGPWAKAVCSLFKIHNIRKLLQLNKVHNVKYAITKIIIYTRVSSSCCNLLLHSKKCH